MAAKETSKRRVAEARKRVTALDADVKAREEYRARDGASGGGTRGERRVGRGVGAGGGGDGG